MYFVILIANFILHFPGCGVTHGPNTAAERQPTGKSEYRGTKSVGVAVAAVVAQERRSNWLHLSPNWPIHGAHTYFIDVRSAVLAVLCRAPVSHMTMHTSNQSSL